MTKTLCGKPFTWDETLPYYDFFFEGSKQRLVNLDFDSSLLAIAEGTNSFDEALIIQLRYLERWNEDAPRKRELRKIRSAGGHVLTNEVLFEGEDGEGIINALENTGKLARRLLTEVLGLPAEDY